MFRKLIREILAGWRLLTWGGWVPPESSKASLQTRREMLRTSWAACRYAQRVA